MVTQYHDKCDRPMTRIRSTKNKRKSTKLDHVYTTGKVAAAVAGTVVSSMIGIPGLGVMVSEFYSTILKPPLTKRTADYFISIEERLVKLEREIDGFRIQDLSAKPIFISVFMQAYQIALRNHQEEKLEALRNAVINVAKPEFPEDDIYMMFINWIDTFTPWHVKILKFLDETKGAVAGQLVEIVCNNFSELSEERAFAGQIIKELLDHGLIMDTGEIVFPDGKVTIPFYTTGLGEQFLRFIA
jgi:hypothetical protein